MATRFYQPSSGAAAVSPAFGAWDNVASGSPDRLRCVTAKSNTALTNKTHTEPAVSNQNLLLRQFVSDAISAQTITGTVKGIIRAFTDDLAGDFMAQVLLRVVSNDGGTFRSPNLIDFNNGALSNEFNMTTLQSRSFPRGTPPITFTVNSVVASANDRIVLELGVRHGLSGNGVSTLNFGDPTGSADLSETETDVDADAPWFEFSQDLFGAAALPDFNFRLHPKPKLRNDALRRLGL